jgi:hypothetical protein
MSDHILAPWKVCQQRADKDFLEVSDSSGVIQIAEVGGSSRVERANLIAAAPELLEVCRRAKKLLEPELVKEPDRTIFWQLVDAIAKAEGKQ